jgi:tRNA(Ile)-lysidine synthase
MLSPGLPRVEDAFGPEEALRSTETLESTGAEALADRPLFAGLGDAAALLLAVSGGPDSIALMALAACWATRIGAAAPSLHVATVDHGLRPEARQEAEMVAAAARRLGLPHTTLTWTGPKPASRVQERAREARYSLLAEHAAQIGASHLLTAHHADDQAETVLLRLGRGSGIGGLAGMRRDTPLTPNLVLTRPLLAVTKNDLVAFCGNQALGFVDDPSNRDPAYARVRLRAQAETFDALGLDREALLRLGRRMARADTALEVETDRLEASIAPAFAPGLYRADLKMATDAPEELLLRLLRRAIAHVAPGGKRLRLDRLETLTAAVAAALREGAPHRATQGGTQVLLGRDRLIVVRSEPARRRGGDSSKREANGVRRRQH